MRAARHRDRRAAERLAQAALNFRDARVELEAAIAEGAIGEPGLHPFWMARDTVRAALMTAAAGALRPFIPGGGGKIAVAEESAPPDILATARARLSAPLLAHAADVRAGRKPAAAPDAPSVPMTPVSIAMPQASVVFRELTCYADESGRDIPLDVGTATIPTPVAVAAILQGFAFAAGTAEAAQTLKDIKAAAARPPTGLKPDRPSPIRSSGIHARIDVDLAAWRTAERSRLAVAAE